MRLRASTTEGGPTHRSLRWPARATQLHLQTHPSGGELRGAAGHSAESCGGVILTPRASDSTHNAAQTSNHVRQLAQQSAQSQNLEASARQKLEHPAADQPVLRDSSRTRERWTVSEVREPAARPAGDATGDAWASRTDLEGTYYERASWWGTEGEAASESSVRPSGLGSAEGELASPRTLAQRGALPPILEVRRDQ